MRRSHILTLSHTLTYPNNLIFIDTETTTLKGSETDIRPKLIIGVAQYVHLSNNLDIINSEQLIFSKLIDLYHWLFQIISVCKKVNIFAHNWAFDYPTINGFDFFLAHGYELKVIVDGCPPVILKYVNDNKIVTIIDSMNFFPVPLWKLGELVGVKKHENIKLGTYSIELEKYCIDDVNILRLSIINLLNFLRDNNLSRFNHTTSSIALNTFTRRFLNHQIYIEGDDKKTMLGRKSYFGGRTECFKIGTFTGKFYLIDVNSMYPGVMINNSYPVKTCGSSLYITVDELPQLMDKYCLTIDCILNTDQPMYPKIINKRTCFPIGRFRAYLSTPEIINALSLGHIEKVNKVVMYEKETIFKDYVSYFYELRSSYKKAGNKIYADFAKLLMNGLYGKFGQSFKCWEESELDKTGTPHTRFEYDFQTGKRIYIMEIGGKVFKSEFQQESRDSFPAIAAHVTAYARLLLYNTLLYIGRKNVYYCDTDSLLLNETGYLRIKNNLDNSRLGLWALKASYDKIIIRGNKDYVFGTDHKIKGIKKNAEFVEENTFTQLQFGTLSGIIRSKRIDAARIKYITKKLTRIYKKGHVLPNGDVVPFEIDDIEP